MITLKIAYNDSSEKLVEKLKEVIPSKYAFVKLEAYQEEIFRERKKAFKLKGGFSARKSPFAAFYNDEDKIIKVFYTESNECTFENITNELNKYIPY